MKIEQHENDDGMTYPFDLCVLTARDSVQKASFEQEIRNKRQNMGSIPQELRFLVVCDEVGSVGSGTATVRVLHHLLRHHFSNSEQEMDRARILLIHCGGFSKRLPNHSTLGKLFAPLPFHLSCKSQIRDENGENNDDFSYYGLWSMLEMKLAMFACVGKALKSVAKQQTKNTNVVEQSSLSSVDGGGGGVVMVTCADDICIFDHEFVTKSLVQMGQRDELRGIMAFAHRSPVEIGLTHGVFVLNAQEKMNVVVNEKLGGQQVLGEHSIVECDRFLHKPSLETMRLNNAVVDDAFAYTDSSYFMFPDVVRQLIQFSRNHPLPIRCELDCYGDFLSHMGRRAIEPSTRDNDEKSVLLHELYHMLHDKVLRVICCHPSVFYHIGTMQEYIDHLATNLSENTFLQQIGGSQNVFSHLERAPNRHDSTELRNCNFIQSIVKCIDGASPSSPSLVTERFGEYSVIEHSNILFQVNERQEQQGSSLQFDHHSIISSIDVCESDLMSMCHQHGISTKVLKVRDHVFIQTVPLLIPVDYKQEQQNDGNSTTVKKYMTFIIGTNDDLKKESSAQDVLFFGQSCLIDCISSISATNSSSLREIWNEQALKLNKCSIWNANIYPLTDSPIESLFYALVICASSNKNCHQEQITLPPQWNELSRISFGEALLYCDSAAQVERLKQLNQRISMTSLNRLFSDRIDITQWPHLYPHAFSALKHKLSNQGAQDMYHFVERAALTRAYDENDAMYHLEKMRLKRCVSYLLRNMITPHVNSEEELQTQDHDHAHALAKEADYLLKKVICQPYLIPKFDPDQATHQYQVPPILYEFKKHTHRPLSSTIQLPVRINLAGGWTDTPPYCLTHGGTVLNMAIDIGGQHPVQATTRLRTSSNGGQCGFVFVIEDDNDERIESSVLSLSDLFHISTDEDFGMHKAVVSFTLFPNLCLMSDEERNKRVNYQSLSEAFFAFLTDSGSVREEPVLFELCTKVTGIPRGSGLGTSSILIVACVESMRQFLTSSKHNAVIDLKPHFYESIIDTEQQQHMFDDIVNMGLAIEQVLSTGGGWQDQIGGMTRGIKLIESCASVQDKTESIPSLSYRVNHIDLHPQKQQLFNDRMFVVFTGKQRLAKGVLTNVVENHIVSLGNTNETLSKLKQVTHAMFRHMQDWFSDGEHSESVLQEIGSCLSQVRDLNIELSMSTSHSMGPLFDRMQDVTYGTCMIGAGSGGYIIAILKPGISKQGLMDHLLEEFHNISLCDASL